MPCPRDVKINKMPPLFCTVFNTIVDRGKYLDNYTSSNNGYISYVSKGGGSRVWASETECLGFDSSLPSSNCIILGKLLELSVPQFLHPENGNYN